MTYSNACLRLFFVSNQRPASFALLSWGVYLRPRLFAVNRSSSCNRAFIEKSFQIFNEKEPLKLWNDVLVTIWVPAQAKFQLRLGSVPIQLLPAFRDLVFLHIRFCKFTQRNTVKPRFTDCARVIRTTHYYGQFALSLGKENPYIFSKFNPLNTGTPFIWTFSIPPPLPPVSVLTGFYCAVNSFYEENKLKPCLAVADPGRGARGVFLATAPPPP